MHLARAMAPLLATTLALCACALRGVSAIESECSACEVVAVRVSKHPRCGPIDPPSYFFPSLLDLENPLSLSTSLPEQKKLSLSLDLDENQAALASRIAAEGAQTVLDLRGRLGPQAGQRKGKRLDWKSSETRLASLLEGLCDSGTLDADFAIKKKEETVGLSVISKDDDDEDEDDDDDDDDGAGSREVRWLRRRGAADAAETDDDSSWDRVTATQEKEYRSKQLEGWCGRLVSEVEEGLARELAGGGGGGKGVGGGAGAGAGANANADADAPFDARAALCERLTRSCAAPAKKEEDESLAAKAAAKAAPASKKEEQKRSWRGKKKRKQQREEL